MFKKIFSIFAIAALFLSQGGFGLVGTAFAADATVNTEAELITAIATSTAGNTITLGSDITLTSQATILTDGITIDGDGFTLSRSTDAADTSNNSVLGIQGNNIIIKNMIVDGLTKNIHGINAYLVTGISIEDVTVKNNGKSGITVNGAEVSVNNITLSNNTWGGINVDQGGGVTAIPKLDIIGTLDFTGNGFVIWSDQGNAVVVGGTYTASPYSASGVAYIDSTCIANEVQLFIAIANSSITSITLCNDITLTKKVTINRNIEILGNGKTIKLNSTGWSGTPDQNGDFTSNGNFIFKIIDGAIVSIENLTFHGGAAAIQSYGSSKVTTKDITIEGTAFGGISVNTDTNGSLDIKGTLTYDNSNSTDAVIWLDTRATHDNINVSGYEAVELTTIINPAKPTELWYVKTSACVTDEASLVSAIANYSITSITFCNNITTTNKINITRDDVTINGSGFALTLTSPASWNGHYALQAYNVSGIVIENLTFNGGDASLLVNNSNVIIKNIVINNPEFGGIEVSNGTPLLTLQGSFQYNGSLTLPALWIDGHTGNNGFVINNSNVTFNEVINANQYWFTQSSACVTDQISFVAAIANTNLTTIKICNDFTLTSKVSVNRSVNIDGNVKKISGNEIIVDANNVNIKNLTVDASANYGIQIYAVTGVSLESITLSNSIKGGMYVNGSEVNAKNIVLLNNAWGGIEVSTGVGVTSVPKLTLIGTLNYANQAEPAIWIDGKTTNDGWVVNYNSVNLREVVNTTKNQLWFTKKPTPPTGGGGGGGGSYNTPTVPTTGTEVILSGDIQVGCSIENSTYSAEQNTAYQYACGLDITTMDTVQTARVEDNLTRAEFAKMISNYAKNILNKEPNAKKLCKFNDADQVNVELAGYMVTACQYNMMGIDMNDNMFLPNQMISRAEVVTVLSRLYDLAQDGTPYYVDHMAAMKAKGFITIDNPSMTEVRGYVFIMLERIAQAMKK